MDTTIVIEAWTNLMTPLGLMAALFLQSLIVGIAIAVGYELGRNK